MPELIQQLGKSGELLVMNGTSNKLEVCLRLTERQLQGKPRPSGRHCQVSRVCSASGTAQQSISSGRRSCFGNVGNLSPF